MDLVGPKGSADAAACKVCFFLQKKQKGVD